MSDEQLSDWAKQHNLTPTTALALYGSDTDNRAVKARLAKAGYQHISVLGDALQSAERLQRLPHFEQLVYPEWLHQLMQGKKGRGGACGRL